MPDGRQPHQRLALLGIAAVLCAGGSYAVVKSTRKPAPIVFEPITQRAPSVKHPEPPKKETTTNSEPAQAAPMLLVVHATGAVKKPQVVRLPAGSRVDDAIKAAGGPTADADLETINLAAKLVDGSQVFVPHKKKDLPSPSPRPLAPYRGGEVATEFRGDQSAGFAPVKPEVVHVGRAKKEPPTEPIPLNSATSEDLQKIPGIGPATAEKILDYRQEHGGFKSVDELMSVKGIGQKKLDAIRKYLRL